MKATEMRTKSVTELQQEVLSLTKAQFGMRMQKATQQLKNTSELRKVRREVARAKTILTEKGAV